MDTLSEATTEQLAASGRELLGTPRRLVAYVTDKVDTNSPEARELRFASDEKMLALVAKAVDVGAVGELYDAAERATRYLNETSIIEPVVSHRVCFQDRVFDDTYNLYIDGVLIPRA